MSLMMLPLLITSILLLITPRRCFVTASSDIAAITTLTKSMGGAISAAWVGTEVCEMLGIVCDPNTLRIIDIVLRTDEGSDRNSKLHFAKGWVGLSSDSICLLDQLTTLIVTDYWPSISGEIPPYIASLPRLQILDLSENGITDEIPTGMGKLSQLVVLDLADNQIRGSIPPSVVELSSMKLLDISNNRISSEIPSEMGKMSILSLATMRGNHSSTVNIDTVTGPQPDTDLSRLHKHSTQEMLLQLFHGLRRGPPDRHGRKIAQAK
ncbi:leucine-rich repeat receptor-like protein kinase family protein [Striga asiatica]|uniref:Leucine-rich repeat receptor-like protein kinase family protein n=1 Tax=Striga asiatica TaxID=4170 RepID=A0A5A7P281_STRAF|nr:leucine-rich repeat receptor-like protein kinase family protein [Striga asiatica]